MTGVIGYSSTKQQFKAIMEKSDLFEGMEQAIKDNDLEKLENFILQRSNISNVANEYCHTLLMSAVRFNNEKAVKLLLQAGADPNACNIFGHTVLRWSLANKNINMIKLLLQAGANPNYVDCAGQTDLMWAVRTKKPAIIEAVLAYCESALNEHLKSAVKANSWETVALLLKHGADPKISYDKGVTLLIEAAKEGSPAIVNQLLKYGANPNIVDDHGITPLMVAVRIAHKKVVELLLQHGANPNAVDRKGQTPLMFLAEKAKRLCFQMIRRHQDLGYDEDEFLIEDQKIYQLYMEKVKSITKLLLKKGAAIQTLDGSSVLVKASFWGNKNMVEVLLGYCSDQKIINESLMRAVSGMVNSVGDHIHILIFRPTKRAKFHLSQYEEVIKLLLEAGADPNTQDKNGVTVFLRATQLPEGNDFFRMLLEYGADPHVVSKGGGTALSNAILVENDELVKFLLELKVDVNIPYKRAGTTPLIVATNKGNRDIVNLLLQYGADSSRRDASGRTALIWACKSEHWELVPLLLESSKDILNTRDRKRMSALAYARCNGAPADIINLISNKTS